MRALFAIAVALAAGAASAACKTDGLIVFPAPGAVVPLNTRFIIEGAGAEQARVDRLSTEELVLKASDDTVSARVAAKYISAMKRVALVLEPKVPLRPNTRYTLVLDRVLPGVKVLNGSGDTVSWLTASSEDKAPPRFTMKPAVAEGLYRKDGDGVSRFLKLRSSVNESAPAYVLATVQRARGTSQKQVYPVPLNGGEALLGHDGCSGSFSFDDGRAYRIWLELFDAAGNKGSEKLPAIEANAPRPE